MNRLIRIVVCSLVCILPAAASAADPSPFAAEVAKLNEQAKNGDLRAMGIIGSLAPVDGVTIGKEEAIQAARASAEKHSPTGLFAMAFRHMTGDGVEKDRSKAVTMAKEALVGLKPLAEAGDTWAQFFMGVTYSGGLGCEKNVTEGAGYFQKAADRGLVPAQAALGRCYLSGLGVSRDAAEGTALFRKAAEQGLAEGAFMLATCYQTGTGVQKSAQDAVEWMRRAADMGLAQAQCGLGTAYALGKGVEKDNTEAAKWYAKAADQGHAEAQCNLGYFYKKGLGVEKNAVTALNFWRKAALGGSVTAEMLLSVAYLKGDGVQRDRDEAKRWLFMAANSTNPRYRLQREQAAKALKRLTESGSVPSLADLIVAPDPSARATPPPASIQLHSAPKNAALPSQSGSEENVTSGSLLFQPGKPESE